MNTSAQNAGNKSTKDRNRHSYKKDIPTWPPVWISWSATASESGNHTPNDIKVINDGLMESMGRRQMEFIPLASWCVRWDTWTVNPRTVWSSRRDLWSPLHTRAVTGAYYVYVIQGPWFITVNGITPQNVHPLMIIVLLGVVYGRQGAGYGAIYMVGCMAMTSHGVNNICPGVCMPEASWDMSLVWFQWIACRHWLIDTVMHGFSNKKTGKMK